MLDLTLWGFIMNSTLAEWYVKMAEYREREARGEKLSKEERDNWNFMQDKIDDWASDYDMREGG